MPGLSAPMRSCMRNIRAPAVVIQPSAARVVIVDVSGDLAPRARLAALSSAR